MIMLAGSVEPLSESLVILFIEYFYGCYCISLHNLSLSEIKRLGFYKAECKKNLC